jgi:hypothetical protein
LAASAHSMTWRISSKTKKGLTLSFRNKTLQGRQRGRSKSWLILPHKWLEFERTRQQHKNWWMGPTSDWMGPTHDWKKVDYNWHFWCPILHFLFTPIFSIVFHCVNSKKILKKLKL